MAMPPALAAALAKKGGSSPSPLQEAAAARLSSKVQANKKTSRFAKKKTAAKSAPLPKELM
jgi:hypothetical protein